MCNLRVDDGVVTNFELLPHYYLLNPWLHRSPPSLLRPVDFVIANVFMDKMDREQYKLLSDDEKELVGSCDDFITAGNFLMTSWAVFHNSRFHLVIVPELLSSTLKMIFSVTYYLELHHAIPILLHVSIFLPTNVKSGYLDIIIEY